MKTAFWKCWFLCWYIYSFTYISTGSLWQWPWWNSHFLLQNYNFPMFHYFCCYIINSKSFLLGILCCIVNIHPLHLHLWIWSSHINSHSYLATSALPPTLSSAHSACHPTHSQIWIHSFDKFYWWPPHNITSLTLALIQLLHKISHIHSYHLQTILKYHASLHPLDHSTINPLVVAPTQNSEMHPHWILQYILTHHMFTLSWWCILCRCVGIRYVMPPTWLYF